MKITTVRRAFVVCMIAFCCLSAYGQIQKKSYSIGYSVGGTTATESGIMNADFRYNLTDAFRISPSVTRLIKDSGYKGWMLETNLHYVMPINDAYVVYPLVGISGSYWDHYTKKTDTYRKGEVFWGPNVGLGFEIYVVNELIVGLDTKYNLMKKHDQVFIAFRIAYHFPFY